jgi:hypothetical protein
MFYNCVVNRSFLESVYGFRHDRSHEVSKPYSNNSCSIILKEESDPKWKAATVPCVFCANELIFKTGFVQYSEIPTPLQEGQRKLGAPKHENVEEMKVCDKKHSGQYFPFMDFHYHTRSDIADVPGAKFMQSILYDIIKKNPISMKRISSTVDFGRNKMISKIDKILEITIDRLARCSLSFQSKEMGRI